MTRSLLWLCQLGFSLSLLVFVQHTASAASPGEEYLAFDGSAQYVEIPYRTALDLTVNAFTASAWVNPASWGQNSQGRIIDHGGGSSGNSGWSLQLENQSSNGFPQALRLQINNDSSFNSLSNNDSISLGSWQHVAVTFDAGTLTFYANGIESGIRTGVPVPAGRVAPLRIGMRATDVFRGFEGGIDEVRIWDRALSPAEIQANMNIELTGSEAGLLAYYRFNEGAGQSAADSTGNGHDATLGSSPSADANDPLWVFVGPPVNQPPMVSAGPDQVLVLPDNTINLDGTVSDDGLPAGNLVTNWSLVSGPGSISFGDASAVDTTASFAAEGTYTLRLTASDDELLTIDEVTVTVDPFAVLTTIDVTPNPALVNINTTRLFNATGYDQAGNPMTISPTWNSTGGIIDGDGSYTAGVVTGAYTVSATQSAKRVATS